MYVLYVVSFLFCAVSRNVMPLVVSCSVDDVFALSIAPTCCVVQRLSVIIIDKFYFITSDIALPQNSYKFIHDETSELVIIRCFVNACNALDFVGRGVLAALSYFARSACISLLIDWRDISP